VTTPIPSPRASSPDSCESESSEEGGVRGYTVADFARSGCTVHSIAEKRCLRMSETPRRMPEISRSADNVGNQGKARRTVAVVQS
jgi:hypothetical protein